MHPEQVSLHPILFLLNRPEKLTCRFFPLLSFSERSLSVPTQEPGCQAMGKGEAAKATCCLKLPGLLRRYHPSCLCGPCWRTNMRDRFWLVLFDVPVID